MYNNLKYSNSTFWPHDFFFFYHSARTRELLGFRKPFFEFWEQLSESSVISCPRICKQVATHIDSRTVDRCQSLRMVSICEKYSREQLATVLLFSGHLPSWTRRVKRKFFARKLSCERPQRRKRRRDTRRPACSGPLPRSPLPLGENDSIFERERLNWV